MNRFERLIKFDEKNKWLKAVVLSNTKIYSKATMTKTGDRITMQLMDK